MNQPISREDDLQQAVQESLQAIAAQMGEPISGPTAAQLYREAADLLHHLDYAPITLARVAGTLLVYRLQKIQPEELDWLQEQIAAAPDAEAIEELLESLSRLDSL